MPYIPTHKIGDSLELASVFRFGGKSGDFTDFEIASTIKGNGFCHALDCRLAYNGADTIAYIEAAPEKQHAWRPCLAKTDIRIQSPSGRVLHGPTREILLVSAITEE
jgi:hypothetical protein